MLKEINTFLIDIMSFHDLIPHKYVWITLLFLVIFCTLALNLIANWVLNRLVSLLEKTRTNWDDAILRAAKKPIAWFIWFGGGIWAFHILAQSSDKDWSKGLMNFWQIGVIVIITWFVLRLISIVSHEVSTPKEGHKQHDLTTLRAITHLLKLSTLITSSLIIMQNLGISVSGVLAFGGIGGIAVGFAARDLLANFFGAIMIFIDKPFKIGDWIRSPDRNIEGTVEEIGWRITRIRTFDQRPLYVPNSIFVNIAVENPSRMFNRRIYETFGLRYCDSQKMAAITRDVKKMLQEHPDIDQKRTLIVALDNFGEFALHFFVYTFTKTTVWVDYHEIKQKVLLQITDIVHQHEADFAFPTREIILPQNGELNEGQAIHWQNTPPREQT